MRRRPAAAERLLATVLFTDIVGSTELASRLGDRAWKDLVGRHDAIVRGELKRYGGRELDTAGDGFFALFDRPAQAIDCARAVMAHLVPLDMSIRASVHMGEVEVMGDKVGGMTVHIGARILQLAERDRIVVTGTVRDVAAGSGFAFTDMGTFELKGLPGEWRVFSVERLAAEGGGAVPTLPPAGAAADDAHTRTGGRPRWIALGIAAIVTVLVATAYLLTNRTTPVEAGTNSAIRLDAAEGHLVASRGVGDRPTGVVIAGGSVWVLSLSDQTLWVLDATTNAVLRTPGLPGRPTGIGAGTDSVWITNGFGSGGRPTGAVLRVGFATRRIDGQVSVPDGVKGVAVDGGGGVWVTNPTRGEVIRIDEVTNVAGEPVPVGEQPDAIAAGFGDIWIGDVIGRSLWRLDPASLQATVAGTLRDPPTAIAAGFDRLWVTSTQGNSLAVLDPASGRLLRTLALGGGPRGVAAGSDQVWVTTSAGQVIRVDPTSYESSVAQQLPGPGEGVAASDTSVWVSVQE
jgi:class 3 adenylate cyclase